CRTGLATRQVPLKGFKRLWVGYPPFLGFVGANRELLFGIGRIGLKFGVSLPQASSLGELGTATKTARHGFPVSCSGTVSDSGHLRLWGVLLLSFNASGLPLPFISRSLQ
ncbi:MAG: hypothetical protein O7B35_18110, partial [Deltaproteobacteria bacterium]|nr:hypothetical protein [Deltaproteobacteria bacterium]